MEPNTASRLKERKSNKLKDFVDVSGQLGVTHFVIFSQNQSTVEVSESTEKKDEADNKDEKQKKGETINDEDKEKVQHDEKLQTEDTQKAAQIVANVNVRFARIPRGPTLNFRILQFSLMKDIARSQKSPKSPGTEYITPPLVIFLSLLRYFFLFLFYFLFCF